MPSREEIQYTERRLAIEDMVRRRRAARYPQQARSEPGFRAVPVNEEMAETVQQSPMNTGPDVPTAPEKESD